MKNTKKFRAYKARLRRYDKYGMKMFSECPECGRNESFMFFRFDAKCCLFCDQWISQKCSDPDCPYCAERPDTPSEAFFRESERYRIPRKKEWLRINYQHKSNGKKRHETRRNLWQNIMLEKEKFQ